jgi:hypothetical protein
MSKKLALSLSHTHTISKSAVFQTKLTNVYQLDGGKTDLKKSRAFELEWVVQIQIIGQWSSHDDIGYEHCFVSYHLPVIQSVSQ